MKYLKILFLLLGLSLVACNHKSEPLYHSLPIVKEYEPLYFVFDRDELSKDELKEMPNLKVVINSENDFPEEDLMGLKELKESNIDFRKYTLLLVYYKLPGIVSDCKNSYAKDFLNDIVIFSMTFRLDNESWENPETENLFTYYRNAILVSKIPEEEEVEFRLTY